MKRILVLLAGLIISLAVSSHPWKPSHYIIVDTDGGIDDMKAITMLLASPDVRVLGITASAGVLSAEETFIKVKSLLNSFYHEGVPVGINRRSGFRSGGLPVAMNTAWGNEAGIIPENGQDFTKIINDILATGQTKISFISLGSMSTAFYALRHIPDFGSRVKDFIWTTDEQGNKTGFNYNIDKEASCGMLLQEIPVKIVRNFNFGGSDFYDEELLNQIDSIKTPYGRKISGLFKSSIIKDHRFSYSGSDEMAVLFLHYPDLFLNKTLGNISDCLPADPEGLRRSVTRILNGETVAKNQVVREFPADPAFYFEDIQNSVKEIVERYGPDEWSSGVIANELHRHLGVFSIVGVKMGIRAREYFDTGVDEFTAVSYAGSVPPLSCMNDGLQVSTGATPGHGLLTVINEAPGRPSAEFTYMNRRIRVSLRPEIAEKISSELKEINYIYGLDSNIYWELVRKNSIKYWLSLNRHEVFIIEEITATSQD